ncbi:bifunctional phosphoribosyl-AMP cyclohydrolase/phosphoribosyl-ATP diphosphatase HisIE [Deinococcus radiophilus]|uniref:Histidine biosynthesis bifunctional protein HisIE n=1 Tax=Deinococcus radiophilus TaxID=32062 RepID=A0A431VQ76_9DEIO|nr:bifunctional phosphoribosyl-AMP cyclohydrolase/phosphoribosyl-ATP diphosphatase HisIE [Deinococcus radiophilus]RTR25283.1 bifunctional phosphoribosyl-AMP cyclohydrolase/phosphoribosyl-ATP diphosphatase HisIE [Deinococcus radiophilus]UFA51459.1 bifunctional phosphoribosyl-AMP cyclohydrolase/phosphoribosyl-ATP diphosphatase HisIE [Deinococcus radiophilus]
MTHPQLDPAGLDFGKMDGLLPCVVQDADTAQVLMLGYMNEAALRQTLKTGHVTFFSRSKGRLWTKGESSGHVLKLVRLGTDCDNDALLVLARPHGPTCHTGTVSCFRVDPPALEMLGTLERTVQGRRDADPHGSYTARLLQGEPRRAAQKVGEEGVEVALAAVTQGDEELLGESADLLYHLLVVLALRGLRLEDVVTVLRLRSR